MTGIREAFEAWLDSSGDDGGVSNRILADAIVAEVRREIEVELERRAEELDDDRE